MFTVDALMKAVKIAVDFIKESAHDPVWCIGSIAVLGFLLWRWGVKKLFGFVVITAILLFLMMQVEASLIRQLGEEGNYFVLLVKPLFGFIIGAIFFYYFFVRSDS